MDDLLQVGVITSPHGVHGEVKVFPTTDDVKRFGKLKEVYLQTKRETMLIHVRSVKYFKNLVILGFDEFTNMNDVETLRQCPLLVDRDHAVKLNKDEYFVADLIGIKVHFEEDMLDGTITEVIQTGANDVYEIKLNDGRELLLPAIADCIESVDIEGRLIKAHLLPGLLD